MIKRRRKIKVTGQYNIGVVEGSVNYYNQPSPKNYIKSYNQVMNLKEYEMNTLIDWPILEDIERGDKSEVFIDNDKIKQIDTILTNQNNRRLLLKGAGGRGKTVLSRIFAYYKNKENWDIYFVDVRELAESDIEIITSEIEKIIDGDKLILIIFENTHISDSVTSSFVRRADYFIKNFENCYFLFISRDFSIDEDIDPFKKWKQNKCYILIKPDENLIETIISQFFKANNIAYELTNRDREWIKYNLIYKSEINQNIDGGDLRLLRLYLKSSDFNKIKLFELNEQHILSSLKRFYVIDELSRDAGLIELVGKVSSIFQFDVPFYSKREYEPYTIELLEYLQRLNEKGIIKNIGQYYFTMTHSLDAYYLSRCLADLHKEAHEEFTAFKIIDYLKELPNIPKDRTGENIFSLFKGALRRSRVEFDNIKVFKIMYEEARHLLLNSISINYRIGIITYILQFISRTYGSEEAIIFWQELCKNTDKSFWIDKIQNSDDLSVALLTMNLGKISPEEADLFFSNYIEIHFKRLYLSTNLILFQHFIRYLSLPKIDNIIKEIDLETFKNYIFESTSIIPLNFVLQKFTATVENHKVRDIGFRFLKTLFGEIERNDFNRFKSYLLNQESFAAIQRLRENLNQIYPSLRIKLEADNEFKSHINRIRNKSIKQTFDGKTIIKKKIVKGLLHLKSKDEFIKFIKNNFNDFVLDFESFNTISRLFDKIYKMTYDDKDNREISKQVISRIVGQLSDNVMQEACRDQRFIELLEKIDSEIYNQFCNRCKDINFIS